MTSAPAAASTRAVSVPMPDEAPVTIARVPSSRIPAIASSAVVAQPKGFLA